MIIFFQIIVSAEVWSDTELETIAHQVSIHEGTHRPSKLIVWNDGEDGLSLGIAHFTWYPTSSERKIRGKFAELVEFNAQHGIAFPLKDKEYSQLYAPWQTKEEFLKASVEHIDMLKNYLEKTRHLQVRFIVKRAQESLSMVKSYAKLPEEEQHIIDQYKRFMATAHGRFILVDYLNLAGEAGMYKVISRLKGTDQQSVAQEFVEHAIAVLTYQAENSRNKAQMKWLNGWKNRLSNYLTMRFTQSIKYSSEPTKNCKA